MLFTGDSGLDKGSDGKDHVSCGEEGEEGFFDSCKGTIDILGACEIFDCSWIFLSEIDKQNEGEEDSKVHDMHAEFGADRESSEEVKEDGDERGDECGDGLGVRGEVENEA